MKKKIAQKEIEHIFLLRMARIRAATVHWAVLATRIRDAWNLRINQQKISRLIFESLNPEFEP